MSLLFYKVLHVFGLLMLFTSLAGIWGVAVAGRAPVRRDRLTLSIMHGFGLLMLLVSGFGMLAKYGYHADIPPWAIVKLVIWLVMGASLALAKRKARWGPWLLGGWVLAGTAAAVLCLYKPF